jgi:hypothetical protein
MCSKLEQEGADCKWRGAFVVTGFMETSINDAQEFIHDPLSKEAMRKAIANITDVPAEYVDVDLFAKTNQSRRLVLQQVGIQDSLLVTYAIAVGGDAPASFTVTGEEVSTKMSSPNSGTISDAIAVKVDESFGAGVFTLSVQTVTAPEVAVASSGVSTSTASAADISNAPPSETTAAGAQSTTVALKATTSVTSATFLHFDLESSTSGIISRWLHITMVGVLITLLQ